MNTTTTTSPIYSTLVAPHTLHLNPSMEALFQCPVDPSNLQVTIPTSTSVKQNL